MELTVLTVPDCPNAALTRQRLEQVLAGRDDVGVTWREVSDEQQAARAGMRGSPTLLVDGVDPFAEPASQPSLSCRLYRSPVGRTEGAPAMAALRAALERAGGS